MVKNQKRKQKLTLVERQHKGDSSSYGTNESDDVFQIGEEDNLNSTHLRTEGLWNYPGLSGSTNDQEDGQAWGPRQYSKQRNFAGFGPKGYFRKDERIYEDVCETLMRNPDVDASNIAVKVESGVVYLSGKINSRSAKKEAEYIIEDLPGVTDVRNELMVMSRPTWRSGPESVLTHDLGI